MVEVYFDINDAKLKSLMVKKNAYTGIDDIDLEPIKKRLMGRATAVKKLLTGENINPSLIKPVYNFGKSSPMLEIIIEF